VSEVEDGIARERIAALDRILNAEISRLDQQHEAQVHTVRIVRDSDHTAFDAFKRETADRFNQVNEFRSALDDLGKTMATRRELEANDALSGTRYDEIQKQLTELRSRLDRGPAELSTIVQQQAIAQGRQQGTAATANMLYLVSVVVITAISAVAAVLIATH
jgi:hypothetical protein